MITLMDFRDNLLLLAIGLYLVLNYGFMQIRIPPSADSGLPIGELMLLFSLITINYERLLPRLSATIFLLPFLIWWVLGFCRAYSAVHAYGFWALRDASHVIESLFLIVGFAFASRLQSLERFFHWLKIILILNGIYALSYPFGEVLRPLSPTLVAASGHEVPLFFSYSDTSSLILLASSYYILPFMYHVETKNIRYFMSAFLMGFAIIIFQARTTFLQIIGVFFLFIFYRRKSLSRGFIVIFILLCFLVTTSLLGLHFKGRRGEASFQFLINHFLAIGGIESEGLEGAARGVPQRLDWWWDLYERWTSNTSTFLFGLGYGFPLIDFEADNNVTVREPHNSYISIMARLGLSGCIAFVWMHILLLRIWHCTYRMYGRIHSLEGENRLLILMIYFILVWVKAIGEDAFEKPFIAIPYYFFWGIVLRMNWYLSKNFPEPYLKFIMAHPENNTKDQEAGT